jgi:hypothetical protein
MNDYVIASHGRVAGIDRHSNTTVKMTEPDPGGLITRRLLSAVADVRRISDDEGH